MRSQLDSIFDKFSAASGLVSEIASRRFVYSKVERKKVLFVGFNPSYTSDSKPNGNDYEPYDLKEAVERYPKHYKKFQDLADECGVGEDWTYIDLFFFRETEQKKIAEILKDDIGVDFICQQLRLTIDLMEKIKPEIIVVCNSGAREFFGIDEDLETKIWMGYNFIFDEKFGVDVISGMNEKSIKKGVKSTELIGIPVLFTSTLNYMDRSSKKRLAWQINQILKYHTLFFGESYLKHESLLEQLKFFTNNILEKNRKKSESVTKSKFEHASKLRDEINSDMTDLLELLLKS